MRKAIKFEECKSEVPIVKFMLNNGASAYAVIDTGSEATLFDFRLIKDNKNEFPLNKTKSKINFVGLQDSSETALINTSPTLQFSNKEDSSEFIHIKVENGIVLDLSNINEHLKKQDNTSISISSVLGSDLLTSLNAKIDYKNKEMTINYDLPS